MCGDGSVPTPCGRQQPRKDRRALARHRELSTEANVNAAVVR